MREIVLKLVYYGPGLSGKTTNLQALHALAPSARTGRLMTLETHDDRTLFFDLLPMMVRLDSGLRVRLKLYTVPGQVIHDATRRLVLQDADGIIFVADSQYSETESNRVAFRDLRRHLHDNALPPDLPLVIQFNKRDLPDARSEQELARFAARHAAPVHLAVAVRGEGVVESLATLLERVWAHLQRIPEWQQLLSAPSPEVFAQKMLAGFLPAEGERP